VVIIQIGLPRKVPRNLPPNLLYSSVCSFVKPCI